MFRTFDNVPLRNQELNHNGSRTMYGNYEDGNDLTDEFGAPIKLEYFTNSLSTPVDNPVFTHNTRNRNI